MPQPKGLVEVQRAGMLAMVTLEDETREELRLAVQSATERYRDSSYKDKADAKKEAAEVAFIIWLLLRRNIPKAQIKAASLGSAIALNEFAVLFRFGGLTDLADEALRRARAIVNATQAAAEEAARRRRAPKPTTVDTAGGPFRSPGVSSTRSSQADEAVKDIFTVWKEKVDEGIVNRTTTGAPPNGAATDATIATDKQIGTVVTTEVAASTAEGHADAVADIVKIAPKEVVETMLQRWDATLDNRTCEICEGLDGQTIPATESWPMSPGSVHPRCRCVSTLVRR